MQSKNIPMNNNQRALTSINEGVGSQESQKKGNSKRDFCVPFPLNFGNADYDENHKQKKKPKKNKKPKKKRPKKGGKNDESDDER